MSPSEGFGDVRAELADVPGGTPAGVAPVTAGAPAGNVPAPGGPAAGGQAGTVGASAGHGPAGAPADLVLAGRAAPGGPHAVGTGGPAAGRRDGGLSAARPAVIENTEILIRPAVSVIVCAFTEQRWEDICRAIGSLRVQSEAAGEIILVIDHCPALLRRARQTFRDVTVVPNHFQKGLAGGRNTGVAHAWGDVVAFIDDDAVAEPDWLARLADHYLDPAVLGVGGLVEPAWECGRPGWFPPELDWVVGCSYLGMRSGLGPVRNFIGANMSFRREVLAEAGGFAAELGRVDANPFGCEETELCLRVSQRYPGAVLLYEPAAAVSHRIRRQRARWRYLRSRCYAEGRSKATVASLAGAQAALASERSYVRSTIPRGVGRSLWQAAKGRPSGLQSAFALVMAVLMTGFGYIVGRWSGRKNAGAVLLAAEAHAEVLDAEAWVLESDNAVPDEQTWVLGPDDWLPAIEDWAPDSGPALPGETRGTGRGAANGHGVGRHARGSAGTLNGQGEAPADEPAAPEAPAGQPGRLGTGLWQQPPTPAAPSPAQRGPARAPVVQLLFPWASLTAVAGLWVSGVNRIQAARVATAGFGLFSVLPPAFWAAAALLMLSFCWVAVRSPSRWPALGAHLVVLVVILHATPAIVYGTLRYSWAWKHVGVVDYIIHHGIDFTLGGVLGVYQGWPGFFALNAFLTGGGGLQSALSYAQWALVVNDLLWLGPVLLIGRAFTADWRMIWTAAWVFELGNWVGQDYFSPQGYAYFLYLTVIAVCLRWLGDGRPRRPWLRARLARGAGWARGHTPYWLAARLPAHRPGRAAWRTPLRRAGRGAVRWAQVPEGSLWWVAGRARPQPVDDAVPAEGAGVSRSTRLALVAALVPLMAAVASSHQLTPVMMVIAVGTLAAFRHLRPRFLLPLLALAITAGWIFYGGLPWLQANSSQVWSGFGALWANSSAHIVGGSAAPPDQIIVERGARLLSVAIGMLAVAGFFRYRRRRGKAARRSWNRVALLGVAAVPMVAGNSYGGEIIFRAFLFALPFMAVAGAAAFFPRPHLRRRYLAGTALAVTTVALAGGYFLSNYGTDAMNYFTPQEVAASQWLYRTAPPGAQLIAVNSDFPWAFVHYDRYSYTFLDGSQYSKDTLRDPVGTVTALMKVPQVRVSYLVLTRSQGAQEAIGGPWPPSQYPRVYGALLRSSAFSAVYLAKGVTILRLAHGTGQAPAFAGAHPAARIRHVAARGHTAAVHRHSAVPPRNPARLRALRARYYRRHHPVTIGGRAKAP